jgi:hypothetical protein
MKRKPSRFFEGLPVREGRGDILVQPSRDDIKQAVRKDPQNCAYAVCLKRMLQTSRVYVYASVAYVETLDEKGNAMMERYQIRNHAHAYIRDFDAGKPVAPGGFILSKPTKGGTLEYKRQASRDFANRDRERARQYARRAYRRARKLEPPRQLVASFRNGTGLVHFIGKDGILEMPKL